MKQRGKHELWSNAIQYKGILMLALPGLLLLVAFSYLPMIGIVIPFKKIDYSKGILGSAWVGLTNFKFLFASGDVWRATRNTLVQNALLISTTLVVSLSLALVLYELSARRVKAYMTALFVPYFLSWVVVGYVAYTFLNPSMGIINQILRMLGQNGRVNWYVEPKRWRAVLTIAYLWKNVGYFTILYYASLMGIDSGYFEAASIDGASKLQQIFRISIPLLSPVVIMLTLLQIGKIFFSDFGLFYFVPKNSGALYAVTDVIDTYVFRSLQTSPNLGMTAAAGLCQTAAGFILVMATNAIVRRLDAERALF
ncbi:MAG: ABC transporter permease subunit [Oscillospiraceae bacterium]|jgi:putative aldouronate transport system permease protein|nr:ABC transporter permease subunit [Oscillospiraceae bacterium]